MRSTAGWFWCWRPGWFSPHSFTACSTASTSKRRAPGDTTSLIEPVADTVPADDPFPLGRVVAFYGPRVATLMGLRLSRPDVSRSLTMSDIKENLKDAGHKAVDA